jgi:hypothetical protein
MPKVPKVEKQRIQKNEQNQPRKHEGTKTRKKRGLLEKLVVFRALQISCFRDCFCLSRASRIYPPSLWQALRRAPSTDNGQQTTGYLQQATCNRRPTTSKAIPPAAPQGL